MLVVTAIVGVIVALGAPMVKSGTIPVSGRERMAVREMQVGGCRRRRGIGRASAGMQRRWINWGWRRKMATCSRWY